MKKEKIYTITIENDGEEKYVEVNEKVFEILTNFNDQVLDKKYYDLKKRNEIEVDNYDLFIANFVSDQSQNTERIFEKNSIQESSSSVTKIKMLESGNVSLIYQVVWYLP